MFKRNSLFAGLGLLVLVSFTGCVPTHLSKVSQRDYGRVAFAPVVLTSKDYAYSDATMQGTRAGGVAFGMIGALVASGIAAEEEKAGRSHVAGVVERSKFNISESVAQRFSAGVASTRRFSVDPKSPQATFYLTVESWGFASGGPGKLAASLWVNGVLRTPAGKTVWRQGAMGLSHIVGTPKDFQADPALFQRSFDDVAEMVSKQLTSDPPPPKRRR